MENGSGPFGAGLPVSGAARRAVAAVPTRRFKPCWRSARPGIRSSTADSQESASEILAVIVIDHAGKANAVGAGYATIEVAPTATRSPATFRWSAKQAADETSRRHPDHY
jgi:hypothetical protein